MEVLHNIHRMDNRIMEIKNLKKLLDRKLSIESKEDVENYMNALDKNFNFLNKKKNNSFFLANSEKLKNCGYKKGRRRSRNSVSSNLSRKGKKNENGKNNNNGGNGNKGGNRNNGGVGDSGDNGNNEGDSDDERHQKMNIGKDGGCDKKKKKKKKGKTNEEGESSENEGNDVEEDGEDEISDEKGKQNEDVKMEGNTTLSTPQTSLEENNEKLVYDHMINIEDDNDEPNVINENASSIREYSLEDSHIKACLSYDKSRYMQITEEEARKIGKKIVSNPFTASSCEDEREDKQSSTTEISYNRTDAINRCIQRQQTKIKLRDVLKELKFKSACNIEYPHTEDHEMSTRNVHDDLEGMDTYKRNSNVDEDYDYQGNKYNSFIKHYVTHVGDFGKNAAKRNLHSVKAHSQLKSPSPTPTQSFGFTHLYKASDGSRELDGTHKKHYNSRYYAEGNSSYEAASSKLNASLSSLRNEHTKKEDCNFGSYMTCSGENNINKYFEENLNCMEQPFKEFRKYIPNHVGYYEKFNYMKAMQTFKNYDCTNAKEFIQNYNCAENMHQFVGENTFENGVDLVKKHVNLENVKKHVNLESVKKRINIRSVKDHINFESLRKHINLEGIVENVQCFDDNYDKLEDVYKNYVNRYVDEVKKTIYEKKEYYARNVNCNYDLISNNLLKTAATNIRHLNSVVVKNKSKFNLYKHKKYIAFNHKKYVGLLNTCYRKRVNYVKKKIEVNKEFLNNYFNACTVDCNNRPMESHELSKNSSFFDYGNIEVNSQEQTSSLNLADMRLHSLFKNSNSSNFARENSNNSSEELKSVDGTYSNNDYDCSSQVNIPCFGKGTNSLKYMKAVLPDNGGEESDIIYDERKKIFFDLNDNAYIHVNGKLYFNAKDKLFYEIEYADEVSYDHVKNGLLKLGSFLLTEKYAPCKMIMKVCSQFNEFMHSFLRVRKYNVYYADKENLVEIIIK
ncbi:hypothetical protein POVCU2_0008310 [Plasmodium ovale curtisi]|uniref:Uncharacterized protein n=1 Tax=Plasmodium ovale curtisi TaxID=864141 RepID=A0A1A8VQK7_PLAOA|nr:hypothetical protein POVCU2_0008310 [Plasmodium ovale curtisi]